MSRTGAGGTRGPLDLRLAPAALLCWLGCWWVVARPVVAGLILTAGALVMVLVSSRALTRPARARHRHHPRDRLTATVALTAVLSGSVLGLATVRSAERESALEAAAAEVSALVRPSIEPQPRAGSFDEEGYRVPARLVAVGERDVSGPATTLEPRDIPVLLLTDGSWRDAQVGSTWWVQARLVRTAPGDPAAALVIVEPGAVRHEPPGRADRIVNTLRAGLVEATAGLSPQARGLVPGISLGDTRSMPPALEEQMRTVSLTHITAVSGAHVAIVLGAVLLCLWWAPMWLRATVGALTLLGFVALVYPSGSVMRAATMGMVLLLGLATGRPRSSIPALLAAIVVLLGIDPWLARDFGFVLSVVATAGLLVLAPAIAEWLRHLCPPQVAMGAAVSMAAQLVCAPVILLLSPGLPTHGVLANVLAMPAVPGATLLGVAATVAGPFWPGLAAMLATIAGWFTTWIATVATISANLPLATLPWPEGPGGAVLVAVALVSAGVWWKAGSASGATR